jgi:hypothetical protein
METLCIGENNDTRIELDGPFLDLSYLRVQKYKNIACTAGQTLI